MGPLRPRRLPPVRCLSSRGRIGYDPGVSTEVTPGNGGFGVLCGTSFRLPEGYGSRNCGYV